LSDGEAALRFNAPARALSLLAYLIVHSQMALRRDAVAFALWPDDAEVDARAHLRRHLYYLLNDALPSARDDAPWILADKKTVQWNPEADAWCDVAEFQRYGSDSATAADVAGLYRGDFLEGFDDEWVQAPRDRFREKQIALLLDLIASSRTQGESATAIGHAKQLLAVDPWREDGIRALIALRYESGDRAGALSTYRDFAKRLEEELGVAPMAETTVEYERVASADEPRTIDEPRKTKESISNTEAIRPTPSFTGREAELAQIDTVLWDEDKIAALVGLGGIGKSAIAREYARRNRHRFGVVWLINSESESSVIDGLVCLGSQLVTDLEATKDRRAAAWYVATNLLRALSKPALLIFDDLDDERLLREWMPHGARVLVTSRRAGWGGDVTGIRVATWQLDETVRYLMHEMGRADVSENDARALAQSLGCLPLAIAHAAAYLKTTPNVTVRRYLDRIGDHLTTAPRGADHDRAVLATFSEAIVQAEGNAPGAAALLALAAYFAPDAIPEELFSQCREVYADGLIPALAEAASALDLRNAASNAMRADEALAALHDLSLVVFSPESRTYALHKLVQQSARGLSCSDEQTWLQTAVTAVESAFPSGEFATWSACQRLLPHARAVLSGADERPPFGPAARLAGRCGCYLARRAAFNEAESLLRLGLTIAEHAAQTGSEIDVASNLNALAGLLRDTNRYAEAEPLHRRALEIYEASLGPQHAMVARVLNDLAILLHYGNRLVEAEDMYRRALSIDESEYGPNHPVVAVRLHNLAILLHETNRPLEAEPLLRRALAIDEAHSEANDPDVATDLCSLGWLLFTTGDAAQAEPLLRRAAAIRESAFGPDHPAFAFALNDLAVVLHDAGRLAEAGPLYRCALAVCESSFGVRHPIVAAHLNNLAELAARNGDFTDAAQLYRRALAIDEASYNAEHPNIARDLNNLAGALYATGEIAEARAYMQRAVAMIEASYEEQHPRSTIVHGNYRLLQEAGDTNGWRNVRRSPSRGLRQ
jgi:DNA-binding SARP family transcriptional activator/Flp pilus assembly protein TadD